MPHRLLDFRLIVGYCLIFRAWKLPVAGDAVGLLPCFQQGSQRRESAVVSRARTCSFWNSLHSQQRLPPHSHVSHAFSNCLALRPASLSLPIRVGGNVCDGDDSILIESLPYISSLRFIDAVCSIFHTSLLILRALQTCFSPRYPRVHSVRAFRWSSNTTKLDNEPAHSLPC